MKGDGSTAGAAAPAGGFWDASAVSAPRTATRRRAPEKILFLSISAPTHKVTHSPQSPILVRGRVRKITGGGGKVPPGELPGGTVESEEDRRRLAPEKRDEQEKDREEPAHARRGGDGVAAAHVALAHLLGAGRRRRTGRHDGRRDGAGRIGVVARHDGHRDDDVVIGRPRRRGRVVVAGVRAGNGVEDRVVGARAGAPEDAVRGGRAAGRRVPGEMDLAGLAGGDEARRRLLAVLERRDFGVEQ